MSAPTDLPAVIGGNEIAVLEALLSQVPSTETPASRSTVATRKEAQRKAIENFDVDRLLELQAKMARLVDVITANDIVSWDVVLDSARAVALMAEFLDERDVNEALDARRSMIKEAVFDHLDVVGEPGENGTIEVPELSKKFCREGAGTNPPLVDEQRLQALLGERWIVVCDEEIVPEQIIPAHIEYRFSLERLLDLARTDHEILEALRTCLVPGKAKTPRFAVRDL